MNTVKIILVFKQFYLKLEYSIYLIFIINLYTFCYDFIQFSQYLLKMGSCPEIHKDKPSYIFGFILEIHLSNLFNQLLLNSVSPRTYIMIFNNYYYQYWNYEVLIIFKFILTV